MHHSPSPGNSSFVFCTKQHKRRNQKKFRSRRAIIAFQTLFSSFSRRRREEKNKQIHARLVTELQNYLPQRKTYSRAVLIISILYKALIGKVNCAHIWTQEYFQKGEERAYKLSHTGYFVSTPFKAAKRRSRMYDLHYITAYLQQ